LIINFDLKSDLIDQMSILKYEKKKFENDYGHDKSEWGSKDDSEELEWERYYEARREKWYDENEDDHESQDQI